MAKVCLILNSILFFTDGATVTRSLQRIKAKSWKSKKSSSAIYNSLATACSQSHCELSSEQASKPVNSPRQRVFFCYFSYTSKKSKERLYLSIHTTIDISILWILQSHTMSKIYFVLLILHIAVYLFKIIILVRGIAAAFLFRRKALAKENPLAILARLIKLYSQKYLWIKLALH